MTENVRSSVSTPSKWWSRSSCWLLKRGQLVIKNNYFFRGNIVRVPDSLAFQFSKWKFTNIIAVENVRDVAAARCAHRLNRV